jgi:hypothetical protein
VLGLAALGFAACALETAGEVASEADASVGGSSGTGASDSGWADSPSGGTAGSGGSPMDASSGSAGQSGAAGTGPCLAEGEKCSAATECCSSLCGKGADPMDCNTGGECAACNDDAQCLTTGRCDQCQCVEPEPIGGGCDEPSDCVTGQCGAPSTADEFDCNDTSHCIGCDDDSDCVTGMRCEQCECLPKVNFLGACNEETDCVSGMCGKGTAGTKDCTESGKCVNCRLDSACQSGHRCDDCDCLPKLGLNEACDEASDCLSGNCSGNQCKP